MLLRPLLRRGATAAAAAAPSGGVRAAAVTDPPAALASLLLACQSYAKAKGGGKPASSTSNRGKICAKDQHGVASADDTAGAEFSAGGGGDDLDAEFELPTDPLPPTYDPAFDVVPGGRPLFAFTDTFGSFAHRDGNVYVDFTLDEWNAMLPEGLPAGMMKEFQETRRCAVMVRKSFLDLRDNFRRIVDPAITTKLKGGYYIEGQGSLIQAVLTPGDPYMPLPNEEIISKVQKQVVELFPSSRGLEVTWSSVVKIGQSLYREAPGNDPFRPDQKTPVKNFFLYGSYTKQDYIDSMEGATLSGRRTASAALERSCWPSERS